MNPETKFSRWVVSNFLHEADVQRIEATSGSGIPDINACYRGVEFWIETKIMHLGRTYLRKYQYAWIRRRVEAGGRVFIFSLDSMQNVHIYVGKDLEAEAVHDGHLRITSSAFWIVTKRSITLAEILFHD